MRQRMSAVLSAMIFVATSSSAWAVDLPRFDVRLRCASAADARADTACEQSEEAARHAILAKWASYPLQRKHFCVQAETFRPKGERSYVTLAKCLGEGNATS